MKLLKNGYMIEGTAEEVFLLIKMDEQFEKRVAEKPEKKPAPKTKKIGPKKKDIGKVKALREAGWAVTKIADEFGVAEQTVRNWMKEAEV
jgi:DNA invertase Pin-like site-specific DNA recombinase